MQPRIELICDSEIQKEYNIAYLLNMFKNFCKKIESQPTLKISVLTLYRQSFNVIETTKTIWQREFNVSVSNEEAELLHSWLWAHFKKKPYRQEIPQSIKHDLFGQQNGKCKICKKKLGKDWKSIHVDHCIPWSLVGDELDNNLQLLCSDCNEKKNNKTNYVFENMIGLN